MVNYFLAKTEPHSYSIDRFREELRTKWDGIKNPQALQAVRRMHPGDKVFIYHTGGQSAVVGLAQVVSDPAPDPKSEKSWLVEMEYKTHLEPPTSLTEIKSSGLFSDWSLVRQGRLSTMAAPEEFVKWMRERYPKAKI